MHPASLYSRRSAHGLCWFSAMWSGHPSRSSPRHRSHSMAIQGMSCHSTCPFSRLTRSFLQLNDIPSVGPSGPILSYYGAAKFVHHARSMVQEGYDLVRPFKNFPFRSLTSKPVQRQILQSTDDGSLDGRPNGTQTRRRAPQNPGRQAFL